MPGSIERRPSPMSYFQIILRRFAQEEARRPDLIEGLGLEPDELADPGLEMSFAQQARLFENLNKAFGDGWILDAEDLWSPASQGALGMAVMSATTAGEALFVLSAYATVQSANQRLTIVRDVDQIFLRHSLATPLPDHQIWTATAGVFLATAAMLQTLLGSISSRVRYEFTRAPPDYAPRLQRLLGGEIRWAAKSNAAVIPQSLLGVRLPLADPITHQAALNVLERARKSERAPEGVRARVEYLLANSPSARLPSERAARTVGLSQRTLVRRLADAGVTYRDLIDAELKSRAARWLDSGALSHSEIGERLGFADATGFSRACRRWFKTTS
ncbi:MAG TPA: AraC family transcriptional regulator ligand-binding domain-containing protein [Caulobacteraceae bacterium]|jgi:AraC-like DNA-binding protein